MADQYLTVAEIATAILAQLQGGAKLREDELKKRVNKSRKKKIRNNSDFQKALQNLTGSGKLVRDRAYLSKR